MNKIKYVSLFSGIGGFEQAINDLGGECVLSSEIDEKANKSYEILYGEKTKGDITKINAKDVPDHDLLVGGFPCQTFSLEGKRAGFKDTRGTLFFEAIRIAKEKQPKMLIFENVKGLLSHNENKTIITMFNTINEIGYTFDFNVVNSMFYDSAQSRERIYIVCFRNDLIKHEKFNIPKKKLAVDKLKYIVNEELNLNTFNFYWNKNKIVTKTIADILEKDVPKSYNLSEKTTKDLVLKTTEKGLFVREATIAGYAFAGIGESVNFQYPNSKTRRGRVGKLVTKTIEASGVNQGVVCYDEETNKCYIRKFTPKECLRLQNFSEKTYELLKKNNVSDNVIYKQAGNAVTVSVVKIIFATMLNYIESPYEVAV